MKRLQCKIKCATAPPRKFLARIGYTAYMLPGIVWRGTKQLVVELKDKTQEAWKGPTEEEDPDDEDAEEEDPAEEDPAEEDPAEEDPAEEEKCERKRRRHCHVVRCAPRC
jgi:hypothetical protein